ncbi:MAG: hypothetical protein AAF196_15105 [Planctomycetota bacterium]
MIRNLQILVSLVVVLFAVFGSGASLRAQDNPGQYPILDPTRLERPTVEDEDGKLQWAEMETVLNKMSKEEREARRCPTCEGKGEQVCPFCWRLEFHEECPECLTDNETDEDERIAKCRTCAGDGVVPDILERAPCPGCPGSGVVQCGVCAGEGTYGTAGTDRRTKCPACKGAGHWACNVCRGQRHVETPRLKGGVAEAELKELEKALAALTQIETALAEFESEGDTRADGKAWPKILKPGRKYFPPIARLMKDVAATTKAHGKGSIFQQGAEMAANHAAQRRAALDTYLKTERRLLELCIERQRHNVAIDEEKDGEDKEGAEEGS